jgi:signal transducing adaptor molecule
MSSFFLSQVLEESDPNWWRGTNHRGEGFFPANFVSADLSAEPEEFYKKETRKEASKSDNDITHEERKPDQPVEINEEAIDRLLFLLHEADPEEPGQDSDEMLRLENFVTQMGPLIDSELERVDRKHAQLTQLSSDLIDTINLYHSLMRDTEKAPMRMLSNNFPGMPGRQFYPSSNPYGMPQQHMGMPDPMNVASSAFPPQMTPENYHLMQQHAANMHQAPVPPHMTQNQNPTLPPPEQMMQQQYPPQQLSNMGMGQMQLPAGMYQNNVGAMQPQDHNRIPPPQDMSQAAVAHIPQQQQQQQQPTQLSGTTFPQQQQNHNLGEHL